MWKHETMQLRTVCDKRLYVPITSWNQNFYRYSRSPMAQNGSQSRIWELNYTDH